MSNDIQAVKEFWNNNPLFTGESKNEEGTLAFFEEHKHVYYKDVFANNFEEALYIPDLHEGSYVLDLGCGVGFWTIEILQRNKVNNFYSADLTPKAIEITEKRLGLYKLKSNLSIQNAEQMTFENDFFDHVNCQGVIHHTPDTQASIDEIARVLKPGGTANISVYYRNFFLRNWRSISFIGKLLSKLGAGLKGRGREKIFGVSDIDEITKLYDGDKNPIGKSYTKKKIVDMVNNHFEVDKVFLNFFPARALPFKIPSFFHRFLSRKMGFMIHLSLRKKE